MDHSEALARAQNLLGYTFNNPDLLVIALTHASVASNRLESNERLEFLGDAILGMVVCRELFERYPNYLEGDLTKIKSVVVSRQVCAEIAGELGLTDVLFLGKGMRERANLPTSLGAAVLESVIAAIYLDGGMEPAGQFIGRCVDRYIDEAANSANHRNYKSYLQQYAQKYLDATPQYEGLDEQGPDHSKCFEICVTIGDERFPSAWGTNKKEAEQKAAMLALEHLQISDKAIETDAPPTA